MTPSNPTPTPIASTAMEAARECADDADIGFTEETTQEYARRFYAIIQKHFQPLLAKVEAERAPVQGYAAGIPWSMHLRAYDAYSKKWSPQPAMIDLEGRNCRGGFHTDELDTLIPGWREELSELTALRADLAAKEAALGDARGLLREAMQDCQSFILREGIVAHLNTSCGVSIPEASIFIKQRDALIKAIEMLKSSQLADPGDEQGTKEAWAEWTRDMEKRDEEIKTVESALASRADKGGAT